MFGTISQLDLSAIEKVQFLQINDADARISALTSHLSSKTESLKGIIQMEEKVRRELMPPTKLPTPVKFSGTGTPGKRTNEVDRIRQRM